MVEQTEPNVGQRIRRIREQRGLSLRAVAERCDLSINAISRIERGEASPTVSSLHQLAKALRVPITEFFQDEQNTSTALVRKDQRLQLQQEGFVIESMVFGLRHQRLEPFMLIIDPGTGNLGEVVTHPGQEFVFCLEGEVEYYVGGDLYHLTEGDSLIYEARQPHNFFNPGDKVAQLMFVCQALEGSILARHQRMTS